MGIDSFGSSLDYVNVATLSRNGLDPAKDVRRRRPSIYKPQEIGVSPKERGAKKFLRLGRLLGFVEMVLAAPVVPHGGIELYRADNGSFQ